MSYDVFSSALWNREADGPACALALLSDGSVSCEITDAIRQALNNKSRLAQFRVRFEKAGDGDGSPDLALFYTADSNKNEPGIFQLEVVIADESAQEENKRQTVIKSRDVSFYDDIHIPVAFHIVKNSGLASTIRSKDNVLALFQKSQDAKIPSSGTRPASYGETRM